MNVTLLNEIADLIEQSKLDYDQRNCSHCVAAKAIEAGGLEYPDFGEYQDVGEEPGSFGEVSAEAAAQLWLTDAQEEVLFSSGWPTGWFDFAECPNVLRERCVDLSYVPTAEDAILVLRCIAKNPEAWPWLARLSPMVW